MKRSLFFTLLLLFPFLLNAQSISLGFGKSSSSFVYSDSKGEELDNLSSKSGDVISLGYIHPLSERFDIGFGLERNEYGAQSVDQENNLNWDISYFGVNLGFDYTFNLITISDSLSKINNKLLSAVISTNFSNSWLTSGIQEIDDRVYDLREFDGNFNNLMKMQIGLGLLYALNDNNLLSLKYSFNRGLNNMETDDQELYLSAHHVLLGIVIHLKQNKN
jgi:opacity protein-like surface antigen